MSNMSSFYGGRSGAPFTIVKTFDAIGSSSAEENKIIYTKSYYALDDEGNYLITTNNSIGNVQLDENNFLIKKTAENYSKYNWKLATNDGKTKINQTDFRFPEELGEDMVSFFEKGILTLDEVNYQEYVLIDTITNLNEYLNPDNGKLFRRGMNLDNGLGGAEYIGRIIGPQGFNTGIQLDTFNSINNIPNTVAISRKVSYTDLIPGGGYIENGIPKENKDIQCIYANILDEGGNVLETKIGFKFPYLVNTFKASQISPYADIVKNNELISEIDKDGNVLSEEHSNNNPFYRHWSIKVPYGKKGDSIEEIRIQPTIIPANTPYYNNLETLKADIEANNNYLNKSGSISKESHIPSDAYDKLNYCIVLNESTETESIYKYIDAKLCTNKKVFYIIRNYDETLEGSISIPKEVGNIDSIIKTKLADDGTLTIYYDNGKEEIAENKIRWITDLQVNSEEGANQKLHVTYNTPKSNEKLAEDIGVPINFIKEVYIGTADDNAINNKVKPNCLYVRYSDPNFYSDPEQYITINNKQWVELGILTPGVQGLKILGAVPELTNEIKNKPPEQLYKDTAAYGGVITVSGSMHIFDYLTNQWTDTGIVIGTAETILDNYIITNTDNDNHFLINGSKSALSDTLPLKLNQEDIASSSNIEDFNDINKQGIYSIQKNLTNNKPPIDSCINSNLIALKINDIIHQIFIKEDKVYSRYRNNKNIWTSWENNIGTNFTAPEEGKEEGTRGLVPAPKKTEIGNYFLNSNGKWTSLNNIFARLGENETFTGAPIFSKGFTSQGTTTSTFTNVVSITASDPTDGKALSVTNGISAGNISASGTGSFNSISVNINKASISEEGVGQFASITSTGGITLTNGGITADNGIGQFASISATGNIYTSKGDISTNNGNISATNGDINTTNGNITATGNGKFGSINIKNSSDDITVIDNFRNGNFADVTATGNISTNNGTVSANILSITSTEDINTDNNFNNNTTCAARIAGGLYTKGKIKSDGGVYGAVWNDLADSIVVNKEAEIEAGYCYCLKDNKYIKSSKYLDNGIIGIHSDTYGFKMGEKAGEKQLDCAVAGFVLAYVDKDYLPGTALTCTKDGYLTKIKPKDKQRFPEKVIATYWKDEPAEEWGSDNKKVKVNGRKWVKIK